MLTLPLFVRPGSRTERAAGIGLALLLAGCADAAAGERPETTPGRCSVAEAGAPAQLGQAEYRETSMPGPGRVGDIALTISCIAGGTELVVLLPNAAVPLGPHPFQVVDLARVPAAGRTDPGLAAAWAARRAGSHAGEPGVRYTATAGWIRLRRVGGRQLTGQYRLELRPEAPTRGGPLGVAGAFSARPSPP